MYNTKGKRRDKGSDERSSCICMNARHQNIALKGITRTEASTHLEQ